jgi:hypothetical protein
MRGTTRPFPQYAFMAWHLVKKKHRDNFTFIFHCYGAGSFQAKAGEISTATERIHTREATGPPDRMSAVLKVFVILFSVSNACWEKSLKHSTLDSFHILYY